ncbi:MAG: DUF308 domain-containing protein [Candidatus Saccharimonadales bacterium]
MEKEIRDLWWIPVLRGISSIAFGVLILVWPAATIGVVALLFAANFALGGIMDIIAGVQTMTKHFSGILRLLVGFLQIGIVAYLFRNAGSGLTLALMGLLMAVTLVVLAITMVASALLSDASAAYRWAAGLLGAITLMVGITVARAPIVSIATIIWVLGIYGLLVGPVEIASGFMLKNQPVVPDSN